MTYRVVITPNAEQDLRDAYRYIRKQAPLAARQWIRDARKRLKTLSKHPERCALAPESRAFGDTIRELLFGKGARGTYRALFVILERGVYVLHVRHGSRDVLGPG